MSGESDFFFVDPKLVVGCGHVGKVFVKGVDKGAVLVRLTVPSRGM